MIRVERSPPPPSSFVGTKSAAASELRRVLAHYASLAKRDKPFKGYRVYSSTPVKRALNELFRYKCAYCEIDYGGAPLDVEHFRPKGLVVEIDPATLEPLGTAHIARPGYYWLGCDWSNLLPSCIDCNRPRTQSFEGEADEVTGKSNYFPLAVGSIRALNPTLDCEVHEQRLLLDPCRDDPQNHLEFADRGTIRPKSSTSGPDPKGRASIEVYGLQRDPLVRKREATQTMLKLRISDAKATLQELHRDPNNENAKARWSSVVAEILTWYLAPERPFLAMCRQLIVSELGGLGAAPGAGAAQGLAQLSAAGQSQPATTP